MDYGFYKLAYGGEIIPPELFNRFSFKAQCYLDSLTGKQDIPDEYKTGYCYALCEIADCYFRNMENGNISSENNDGYSVSYISVSLSKQLYDIANLYLGESGLLYRGEC